MSHSRAALASLALLLVVAQSATAGPPGFAFLEVPALARASGLGGAYVALADGIDGAFWNPAGLAGVRGTQLTASHLEFIQGLKHDQFALGGQLFGGGLAGSVRAMYSQPIDERDELGNLIGTFGSNDLEFQLGYGWQSSPGVRLGLAAEVIHERLANAAATTWSGSAGLSWQPQRVKSLSFGVAAQHLGPAAHYLIDGQQGDPVPLPAALQAGAAWHRALAHGLALTTALDTRATRGRQSVVSLGGELAADAGVALRLGVREGDDLSNFSAGLGWSRGSFHVDYAWVPAKLDLGETHRFSIAAQF